jgi:hypothetical protein
MYLYITLLYSVINSETTFDRTKDLQSQKVFKITVHSLVRNRSYVLCVTTDVQENLQYKSDLRFENITLYYFYG